MRAFGKEWQPASYRKAIERAVEVVNDDEDDERE